VEQLHKNHYFHSRFVNHLLPVQVLPGAGGKHLKSKQYKMFALAAGVEST
jgi:hypothetical protein